MISYIRLSFSQNGTEIGIYAHILPILACKPLFMKPTQIFIYLAFFLLFCPTNKMNAVGIRSFVGTWINEKANVSKISINVENGVASVTVWGLSEDGPCQLSSGESFSRVDDGSTELLASVKKELWEAHMMMRLHGERLEVRIVSVTKDGQQLITQKYMSSYNRVDSEERLDSDMPLGGIKGKLEGPAVSTASIFQAVLLNEEGTRMMDRQALHPQNGFYFSNLEDGIYQIQIESPGSTGVEVSAPRFEAEVRDGKIAVKTIVLE